MKLGCVLCWLLTVVLLAMAAGWSDAADWTEFRGPAANGHADATGLPLSWNEGENIAWKQSVAGEGWSSPVLARGVIYLTASVPVEGSAAGDRTLRLLSFDAATGNPRLDIEVFKQDGATAPKIHGKNSHASPTPIVAGDRIHVHFGHQGTACLDTQGKLVWQNRTLAYKPVHGNGGSPVLVDGRLIFSCDGASDPFVVALDANSGEVLWKTARESDATRKFSFSTPLVLEEAGRKQIVSPGSNAVCAFDAETGAEIWRVRYDGYSVIPQPIFGHGLIFLSTGYDSPSLLAIRAGGQGDVTDTHVAWKLEKGAPHTPSLLLIGEELYMVSDRGIATCVDAQTGQVHWQERIGGAFSASPVFADGRIYLQDEDGVGHVLAPGKTFQLLATSELKDAASGEKARTLASYAIGENAIFLRAAGFLCRIQLKK